MQVKTNIFFLYNLAGIYLQLEHRARALTAVGTDLAVVPCRAADC
jgi:hypothetical protein